jgi:hypothetical protein
MTKAEIRAELYALRRALREYKNIHIRAYGERHSTHDRMGSLKVCGTCHACEYYDGQISGLNFAIRRFGGRMRYPKEG